VTAPEFSDRWRKLREAILESDEELPDLEQPAEEEVEDEREALLERIRAVNRRREAWRNGHH